MAASRVWTNPKTVSFTPNGGSAIPITRVTQISVSAGGELLTFSGDGDRYNTIAKNIMNQPTVSVTSADIVKLISLMAGTYGVLTWVMEDARNDDGSGNVTWTLNNAVPNDPNGGASHTQPSSGSVTFATFSADGTTNPLSYVVAA